MCMLTYLSVCMYVCVHIRKCAHVHLLYPCACLTFLHSVKFQAASRCPEAGTHAAPVQEEQGSD